MSSRRGFILRAAGLAAALLAASAGQAGTRRRVGFLSPLFSRDADPVFGPFLQALRARGYRENDNLELEYRSANGQMLRLDALAFAHRLPMMADWKETAQAGALIAYGPNLAALAGRAAVFVDRILRGEQPADLPVEQPSQFDLIVNLRTAQRLGITLPGSVLLRADAMIE